MLKTLIAECTDYEYKVSLETKKPRSWLKTVSAFTNGAGGSLFFGINDEGDIIGIDDIKEASQKIIELIRARIDPKPIFCLFHITLKVLMFLKYKFNQALQHHIAIILME